MKWMGLILVFNFLLMHRINGQDGHYSQFQNAPLYLNPAFTGGSPDKSRFGAIYRTQWSAIHSPYTNYGAFADTKKSLFGFGVLLNQSQAGQASLKNSSIALSLALHKKLARGNNRLSAGVLLGVLQQKFDPTQFTFDEQYTPGFGFDSSLSSQENFQTTSMLLPDLGVGLNWQFNLLEEGPMSGDFGISFQHVNQANSSFFEDNVSFPLKTSVYGLLNFQIGAQLDLAPKLLYMRQLEAQQILMGVDLIYELSELSTLKIGVGNRVNDAIIFYAGLDLDQISFSFSYDNSISELKPFSGQNNSMEISAIFHLGAKTNKAAPKALFDSDGDGVLDRADKCPEVPGLKSNKGCPIEKKEETESDFDGDGVNDKNDLCPYIFGELRFQGCNDRDGDGVWDHIDACPVIPGHPSNYGCPVDKEDADSDGDGILDKVDKCVYVKGLEEFFGCPDSDEDRIPDIYDHCPYLAGIPALDGCPKVDAQTKKRKIMSEVIEFETDKFEIRSSYYYVLDKLILELKFEDHYRIILEGHTDSEGDEAHNYYLSQRRAAAIKDYMIKKGINEERISTFYYGETKPKNSNGSSEGKARNRRTEVILME